MFTTGNLRHIQQGTVHSIVKLSSACHIGKEITEKEHSESPTANE